MNNYEKLLNGFDFNKRNDDQYIEDYNNNLIFFNSLIRGASLDKHIHVFYNELEKALEKSGLLIDDLKKYYKSVSFSPGFDGGTLMIEMIPEDISNPDEEGVIREFFEEFFEMNYYFDDDLEGFWVNQIKTIHFNKDLLPQLNQALPSEYKTIKQKNELENDFNFKKKTKQNKRNKL